MHYGSDLPRVHYRVEPLGGEVAAVRGPDVAQRRATREREEEEKLCFPHPLTNANKQGEIGPVSWVYILPEKPYLSTGWIFRNT